MENKNKIQKKGPFSRDMEGYWKTEGYNYILKIEEGTLIAHEITEISCIQSILTPDGDVGFVASPFFKAKLTQEDKLMLEMEGTTFRYTAKRIDNFSTICENKMISPTNDPLMNFEVLFNYLVSIGFALAFAVGGTTFPLGSFGNVFLWAFSLLMIGIFVYNFNYYHKKKLKGGGKKWG